MGEGGEVAYFQRFARLQNGAKQPFRRGETADLLYVLVECRAPPKARKCIKTLNEALL